MVAERPDLAIEAESPKNDLAETMRFLEAAEALVAKLVESCGNQSSKWEECEKSSRVELLTIEETIKLLSEDDAIVLLKTNLRSPSLVQVYQSIAAVGRRMMDELRRSSGTPSHSASNLKLISFALSGKSVHLSKAISMIDETVTLPKGGAG